jgi:antitoxin component of RelBE/YafQ-DinJ toxin-antitoxin module
VTSESGKSSRLIVRLSPEDHEWALARADDMGLEPSDVVRMLIRQARKGIVNVNVGPAAIEQPAGPTAADIAREQAERERREAVARKRADLERQLAALERGDELEEVEIPPDPDGGISSDEIRELLAQGSSFLGKATGVSLRGPAYSVTQPAGVNNSVGSGNRMGDAHGNLVRTNFGHLGFRG